MKYILIMSLVLITACASDNRQYTSPNQQESKSGVALTTKMMAECGELSSINNGGTLIELMQTVKSNYNLYHECAAKNRAWIEWYLQQRSTPVR